MPNSEPTNKERKTRRARGSGSVYRKGRMYWVSYYGPDWRRHAESRESERKGDAIRLLQRRVGARENNLPVIPRAEQLTSNEAARAVLDDVAKDKRSLRVAQRRIENPPAPLLRRTPARWHHRRRRHRLYRAPAAAGHPAGKGG